MVAIAAGGTHSVAVLADSTVRAWGLNSSGQLGNNSTVLSKVPVTVSSLSGVIAVAGGGTHSLAMKSDGTVWGWGANASGQVGNNSTTNRLTPAQASAMSGATAIAAGNAHSTALKSDGTVWVWGSNASGQLAKPTSTTKLLVPTTVTGLTGAAGVAAGTSHTVALLATGAAKSWGLNTSGQDGDATTTSPRTSPVNVSVLANVLAGTLATYAYNGDGLRASKTVLGATTPFTWSAAEGLPLLLSDGTTNYVYGPGGMPIESVTGTTPTYFHHDQLGSTRMLTDAVGNATATFSYDPYGTTSARTGTATIPLGYAGEYTDTETGFQYLRARYLDPATGQFLSRDPANASTRAAYGYVGGSPQNGVDPSGLLCFHNPFGHDNCQSFWKQHAGTHGPLVAVAAASLVIACVAGGCEAAAAWAAGTATGAYIISTLSQACGSETGAIGGAAGEETVGEALKAKLGSITNTALPPGSPSWDEIRDMTLNEVRAAAQANETGYKTIYKLLTSGRFNKS